MHACVCWVWGRGWGPPQPLSPSCLTSRAPLPKPLPPLQEGAVHSWLSSGCCAPGTMKRMFATRAGRGGLSEGRGLEGPRRELVAARNALRWEEAGWAGERLLVSEASGRCGGTGESEHSGPFREKRKDPSPHTKRHCSSSQAPRRSEEALLAHLMDGLMEDPGGSSLPWQN